MSRKQRKGMQNWLSVLIIVAVIGVSLLFLYPPEERIKLGLDLQGGVETILQAQVSQNATAAEAEDTVERIITILDNRVNEFGLSNTTITKLGAERILVQMRGTENPAAARSLIGQTALLEFKKVIEVGAGPDAQLQPGSPLEEVLYDDQGVPYLVEVDPVLTGAALADASMQVNSSQQVSLHQQGRYYVQLRFNDRGGIDFANAINALAVNDQMAIVLDGVVQSAPAITQGIKDAARNQRAVYDATITGDFTLEEARQIAIVLRAGALPVDVSIIQENTVGPTLGQDAIQRGQLTILIGFGLVLVYMLLTYRLWGVVADFVLLLNMLIIFGALSIFQAALTLPGIAGLLLTIGMSVDANVIIFERVKEERRAGKTPQASLRDGFAKSLSTVLDANITTLAAAAILFTVGTGPIRGFAITLGLGILGSLFCALFVTRFLLDATGLGRRAPGKLDTSGAAPQTS